MKIMIIRHAEPDYTIDSLTEKGWREAKLLADRMEHEDVKAFYVSPLGRAKDTASFTLEKFHMTATECDWLREFPPKTPIRPNPHEILPDTIVWDWLPEDWLRVDNFYLRDKWYENPVMESAYTPDTDRKGAKAEYDYVTSHFDEVLAKHGYRREGDLYRVEKANRDTIVFFCHFGLESVLLSHLINISPMILWHYTMAAPSSVTTLYSEERIEGKAIFRIQSFGDLSHIYVGGEAPSFAGRFCETYDCEEERH
jgi:probable phosphoglycerate mutase